MRNVNQPQSWWGWHGWNHPEPLSIVQILQSGTMPPRLAAVFWLGLERGASFTFAADPPSSGKTTILTALLSFASPETVAYFTRGWGETFDLPPPGDDHPTYLMVNEVSDHLPVYSWGPYVVRVFELMKEGYSLCTTMHADTIDEVIEQFEEDIGVPREHLAQLTFVVPIAIRDRGGAALRRVLEVGLLGPAKDGLEIQRIASWDERHDAFSILGESSHRDALAERLGLAPDDLDRELDRREVFLQQLVADGVESIEAVDEAVDAFREGNSGTEGA